MMKRRYDSRLISGTICGGGSLGTIIPPSIPVIVLAPLAGLPVGDLFAGIMLPGLSLVVLFGILILGWCWLKPKIAHGNPADTETVPLFEKLKITAMTLVPPLFLIVTVLDRKSVVSVRRVKVSVAVGVSSIIKKKKQQNY